VSATNRGAERSAQDFYSTPAWCVRAVLREIPPGGVILDPCCGSGAILAAISDFKWGALRGFELDAARAAKALEVVEGGPIHWLTPAPFHAIECRDALSEDPWLVDGFEPAPVDSAIHWRTARARPDIVLTNPPYSLAMPFVLRALREASIVVMLLRLNWLASMDRLSFHRKHPADVFVLPRRPAFVASLSCGALPKETRCGWRLMLPIDAPRPKHCGGCGARVACSTSDATEYAWFAWGLPGGGGRWRILDVGREATAEPVGSGVAESARV
jgi:hypothetical protein